MHLSDSETELLASITDVLEQKKFSPTIGEEEISTQTLQQLLSSETNDLALVGLYVLSLRPDATKRAPEAFAVNQLTSFVRDRISARNVTRYLIGELSPSEVQQVVQDPSVSTPTLRQAFEEVQSSLAQPLQSATTVQQTGVMTIIVHGTWAASSTWWQPGGNFWNYINSIVGNVYNGSDYFSWSGANRHSARVKAANELIAWTNAHPTDHVDIIAHSHGGNACILASRLGLKIRKLILLGNPVRLEYLPMIENIETMHNVFSTGDLVQTPPATIPNRRAEGRTFGDSLRIANHRAEDDGNGGNPGHSDLHEPATWSASGLDHLLV